MTRGELPLPQRAPLVREPVRVGGGKFRYRSGKKEATAKAVDPRRKDSQLCLSMALYSGRSGSVLPVVCLTDPVDRLERDC